ncbi:MAG: hypothetical protein H6707_07805 [Deltaproteobacteria bacterium]|nr:hypothetical protein [Deltaproteobacteria bacterium]
MHQRLAVTCLFLTSLLYSASLYAKRPAKIYVAQADVQPAPDSNCQPLIAQATAVLPALLSASGKVVDKDPQAPTAAKALETWLKAKRFAGYRIVVRLVRCATRLDPPLAGKRYPVQFAEVASAIDAERVPSGQMALAGTGDAQIGIEVSKPSARSQAEALKEALTASLRQAIERFVRTALTGKTQPKKRARKRSRRR